MYFNGLRIQVAGAGVDATLGAFTDGQIVTYDATAATLKGLAAPPAFTGTYASGDVPVWNGSAFAPVQRTVKRITGASQTSTSTAYADVGNLTVTINRLGQVTFDYFLIYQTSAVAEGIGLQLAFTGTAGGINYTIDMFTAANTRADLIGQTAFGGPVAPQAAGPGLTDVCAYICGSCNVTAVGDLSLQFRAETGGANSVIARIGSWGHVFAL